MFTPEHLHVALNHIALIGLAVAVIPLLIALLRKDRGALQSAWLIILLCGLSIPVVMITGENGAARLTSGAAGIQLDTAAQQALAEHEDRAEKAAGFVYAATGLAVAGLLMMRFAPKHQYKVAALTLAACLLGSAMLIWTAEAGGQIRHSEFRPDTNSKTL